MARPTASARHPRPTASPTSVASPSVFSGSATTTYRLDGLLATRASPNGETLTLAYDAARRPLTATLAAGNTISQTYDRVGNVTTEGRSFSGITGDPGSGTNTFSYDPLRRLTAESGLSASRSYQYDLDGNRTRKVEGGTTIDYTYDRTDQLITQTIAGVGTAFSYDPYGNLTQAGNSVSAVTTYTFDTASHLATINAPGTAQDVALTLDALGRFASRTVNGGTDTYGYLGASETATTIVGATTRVSALAADGSRVATKDGSTTGYLLPDLHGNVVAAEASASTTISNALRYDGYGQTLGTYTGTGPIAMDVKYQGRLDLSATDDPLYDMSARFYAPGTGTFTQLDSVMGSAQNPLSMNRFLYAEANPTSFIDPTGHYVTESDGDQDNPCRYKGDAGCGETANCSTCKLEPPTKPKPKPGDNDSSDNTDDTCPLCNDKDDKDVTAVTWNYEEWQKSIEDQGIPDWARDGDKVDAHGCRIAVKGWCSHPASLTDLVIFTVIVVGGIVVVLVLGPVIVEAGVSTAAVYAATGATGVANMAAPSLTKIGQIILEGEGGATLPRVTLYRGVGSSELADITATGTYRIAGSSAAFGKYFYPTMDQAKAFVDKGWASRVTSATFPQVAVDSAERLNPAGEGPALFILAEYFPYGPVTIH